MVNLGINGIIIRVKGNVNSLHGMPILGKTMEQWVADAVNVPCVTIDTTAVINMADKIRPMLDRSRPITIVLYADAPLITGATVESAINQMLGKDLNVVKMPRGMVFKTEYLYGLETLFPQEPAGSGEFEAVKDGESLSHVTDALRRRILSFHASRGVLITDYNNVYIDHGVTIEPGAVIEPYNFIKGKSTVKAGAHIMPGNYIENCIIGSNARIDSSRLYASYVGEGTRVGPFAYIRPESVIGNNCRIGDFVELKSCVLGDGCKVSHLSYIGDAELGAECNVGCGVVFANYDGKNKYRSVVGSRVFIGSNANIIAPVHIADRAFIAAGSTVTDSVPAEALAIARARQVNLPHWKGNLYAPPTGDEGAFSGVVREDGIIDASGGAQPAGAENPEHGDSGEN